jgi:hypothetical protein
MQLLLTHGQRLNLIALLGAQRANLDALRMFWKMQDKLALDEAESKAINLQKQVVGGEEIRIWQADAILPAKEFEFIDAEVAHLRHVINTWTEFQTSGARQWLEPLLEQLAGENKAKS